LGVGSEIVRDGMGAVERKPAWRAISVAIGGVKPGCSSRGAECDSLAMAGDPVLMSQLTGTLVLQNANIAILSKALQQQKIEGQATVDLIQGSGVAKGAPEPGKGCWSMWLLE